MNNANATGASNANQVESEGYSPHPVDLTEAIKAAAAECGIHFDQLDSAPFDLKKLTGRIKQFLARLAKITAPEVRQHPRTLAEILADDTLPDVPAKRRDYKVNRFRAELASARIRDAMEQLTDERLSFLVGAGDLDGDFGPPQEITEDSAFELHLRVEFESRDIDLRGNVPADVAAQLSDWADVLLNAAEEIGQLTLPGYDDAPQFHQVKRCDTGEAVYLGANYHSASWAALDYSSEHDCEVYIVSGPLNEFPELSAQHVDCLCYLDLEKQVGNEPIANEWFVIDKGNGSVLFATPFKPAALLFAKLHGRHKVRINGPKKDHSIHWKRDRRRGQGVPGTRS